MPKDVVDGLRMFAGELRRNAERSVSQPQQASLSGRAMIIDGAANEIEHLRAALVSFIQCAPSGIAGKIVDGDPALEPFRKYLKEEA